LLDTQCLYLEWVLQVPALAVIIGHGWAMPRIAVAWAVGPITEGRKYEPENV